MRNSNSSLIFVATVCVLVIGISIVKGSDSHAKDESNSVVYPDYYYAEASDINTTDKTDTQKQVVEPEVQTDITSAMIADEDTALASTPTVAESKNDTSVTSKKTTSAKKNNANSSVKKPTSTYNAKSRLLADMANSSVLTTAAQNAANTIITAKAVKYQALANGAALSIATVHNQKQEALADLITAKHAARSNRASHLLNVAAGTTKDVLDTALTIHNDINGNVDQVHEDVKTVLDGISEVHDEVRDIIHDIKQFP